MDGSNKKSGFTLIELLIVISIIGLLSSIVLASVNGARINSRNTYTAVIINQYIRAITIYYLDNGYYPGTNGFYCLGPNCFHDEINDNGPQAQQNANFDAKIKPYYSAFPDPSPPPTDSVYISGATYICSSPQDELKCGSVPKIYWVKNRFQPCIVPNATYATDFCYVEIK